MDTLSVCLVMGMLFLAILILVIVCLSKNKQQEDFCSPKKRLEFMKIIMLAILCVWILANFVGFWVVIFVDVTKLDKMLEFAEKLPLLATGAYAAKAGAENITKNKATKTEEYTNEEEYHE